MVYEMDVVLLLFLVSVVLCCYAHFSQMLDRLGNTRSSFVVELKLYHYHSLGGPKQPKSHHKSTSFSAVSRYELFPPLSLQTEAARS